MFQKRIILLFILLACNFNVIGQTPMTMHSPKKASLYSVAIPGLGQYYNKKYWKIPIIYIALAASLSAAKSNNSEYLHYKKAYEYRIDEDQYTIDPYVDIYSESNLITRKNYFRKYRDLSYIVSVGVYLMNILDASIDAHLFNFNVNENISLNIEPLPINMMDRNSLALSLKFNFD